VARRGSAKPLFTGSNPVVASLICYPICYPVLFFASVFDIPGPSSNSLAVAA
jgi:hypothetical protein